MCEFGSFGLYIECKVKQIKYNQNNEQIENVNSDSGIQKHPRKIKKFLLYGKSFIPFFLSHHPECENFKGHTINCGKIRLCIGCFIGYPTAIITIFLLGIFDNNNLFSSDFFLILSLVFLGTFFLSLLNLTKIKIIKIIQKFLIGLGAALLFNWLMERPSSRNANLRTTFVIFYGILIILNLYHAYGIMGSCYRCETPFNWGVCSGFCKIRERMKVNDLDNFLLNFESFSLKLLERRARKKK
ncbi:MAG: hypothetical protein KGD58_06160 [Candidatus Lokiarchaeota archaeon]|nr:hypothetical protein [Candidatus Lokiarchaeota archaeon]